MLGMSQELLGEAIGLTFQQVQKYERGANRVGASRLFELSRVLDVPIGYFFDDMGPNVAESVPSRQAGALPLEPTLRGRDPFMTRETLELARAYYDIPDEEIRKSFYALAKSLARQTRG